VRREESLAPSEESHSEHFAYCTGKVPGMSSTRVLAVFSQVGGGELLEMRSNRHIFVNFLCSGHFKHTHTHTHITHTHTHTHTTQHNLATFCTVLSEQLAKMLLFFVGSECVCSQTHLAVRFVSMFPNPKIAIYTQTDCKPELIASERA